MSPDVSNSMRCRPGDGEWKDVRSDGISFDVEGVVQCLERRLPELVRHAQQREDGAHLGVYARPCGGQGGGRLAEDLVDAARDHLGENQVEQLGWEVEWPAERGDLCCTRQHPGIVSGCYARKSGAATVLTSFPRLPVAKFAEWLDVESCHAGLDAGDYRQRMFQTRRG